MPWAYVLGIRDRDDRIKVGAVKAPGKTVEERIDDLQGGNPDELYVLWKHECVTQEDAFLLEAALKALFERSHVRGEFYAVAPEEARRIGGDHDYLLRRIAELNHGAPVTIEDCVKKRLVKVEVTCYEKYVRGGKTGSQIFIEKMRLDHGVDAPMACIKLNYSSTRAGPLGSHTAKISISPWNGHKLPEQIREALRNICGKRSEVKGTATGGLYSYSNVAITKIAPLIFPRSAQT